MIPVILTFSLNIERTTKTDYILHTLPVFKSAQVLFKFLAALSMGTVYYFITAMFELLMWISNDILMLRSRLDISFTYRLVVMLKHNLPDFSLNFSIRLVLNLRLSGEKL